MYLYKIFVIFCFSDKKLEGKLLNLKQYITNVNDYPKKGIIFKDITTLLENSEALHLAIEQMKEKIINIKFDTVLAIESRGFLFGAPLAYALNKRLVIVRKKGKLPRKTIDVSYTLEYGTDTLAIHEDSLTEENKVIIVDDLLATGGTTKAVYDLVEKTGAEIKKLLFMIELTSLNGKECLPPNKVISLLED